MDLNYNIINLFPVPIHQFDVNGFSEIKDELIKEKETNKQYQEQIRGKQNIIALNESEINELKIALEQTMKNQSMSKAINTETTLIELFCCC